MLLQPGLMTSVRPIASHFPTRSDIHLRGLPDAARSLKPARWVNVDFSTSGCADASWIWSGRITGRGWGHVVAITPSRRP